MVFDTEVKGIELNWKNRYSSSLVTEEILCMYRCRQLNRCHERSLWKLSYNCLNFLRDIGRKFINSDMGHKL